jgi:hypothetical protein
MNEISFASYIKREGAIYRFIPHSGFAHGGLNKIDRFAEFLAEGFTVSEAAKAVGWSAAHGNAMLQRIRKRLGRQAR